MLLFRKALFSIYPAVSASDFCLKSFQNLNALLPNNESSEIYADKQELLELYNAVNGTNYDNPEELEINTLENAIYLSMRNDVSFIIDSQLSLYEHQSTYNPNLPLRYLMYVSDLYSKMIQGKNIYGSKVIPIPPPKFLIFYNGVKERPAMEEMRLSDAFAIEDPDPSLELKAVMININPGYNDKLLKSCKSLRDYVEYVSRVRKYAESMEIEDAVERAITECIKEGILADFLTRCRSEAKKMSIYEYDEEKQRELDRRDWMADGIEVGRKAGIEVGRQAGMKAGEERLVKLYRCLTKENKLGEFPYIMESKEYREKMFMKYNL